MKLITLFGATGALGLFRAILTDPNCDFVVRAIARETKPDQAKEPVRLAARIVAASDDNEGRVRGALGGAYWRMRGV